MKVQTAIYKVQLRVNKIASGDYDNLSPDVIIEALNKFQLDWSRKQINGANRLQEGDEESKMKVDDLQILLVPNFVLKGKNHETYFESDPFPNNYLYLKRVIPKASSGCCTEVPMISLFVEEANIPNYLQDWAYQPSFEWRQTLHTLISNRLRVYKQKDFLINEIDFVYYRKPRVIDIHGYTHEDGTDSINSDIEFKDDVAEIIVDGAAAIIAGDIESPNASGLTSNRTDINT